MTPQNVGRTTRERARAELTREIKEEARRQLAAVGADGLSLRAVARSLGMVSSALYRYFPSRDDLLTSLIIDAYNAQATPSSTTPGVPRAPAAVSRPSGARPTPTGGPSTARVARRGLDTSGHKELWTLTSQRNCHPLPVRSS